MAHGVPALHPERKGVLNISPKVNAVEARGGLPSYVVSVATALMRGGMTRSHAIAAAREGLAKTCTTGHWFGRPKSPVSGAIKAAACAATASLKARNLSDERLLRVAIELARAHLDGDDDSAVELTRKLKAGDALELAFTESLHPRGQAGQPTGGEFVPKGNSKQAITQRQKVGQRFAKPRQKGVKVVKLKTKKMKQPKRVILASDHTKAGLHRVGRQGNRYVDRKGAVFHRIGKGKHSRFVEGEPPRTRSRKSRTRRTRVRPNRTPPKTGGAKPVATKGPPQPTGKSPKAGLPPVKLSRLVDRVLELSKPPAKLTPKERQKLPSSQTFQGDRFPIRNRADLARAVRAIGRAKPQDKPKIKAFIRRRAKALGAADAIPSSW